MKRSPFPQSKPNQTPQNTYKLPPPTLWYPQISSFQIHIILAKTLDTLKTERGDLSRDANIDRAESSFPVSLEKKLTIQLFIVQFKERDKLNPKNVLFPSSQL